MTELNAAIALFVLFTAMAAGLRALLTVARPRARALVLSCAGLTSGAALAAQAAGRHWLMDLLLMLLLVLVSAWLLWPRRQGVARRRLR